MLRSKPVEVAQIFAKATGLAPEVNGHVISAAPSSPSPARTAGDEERSTRSHRMWPLAI